MVLTNPGLFVQNQHLIFPGFSGTIKGQGKHEQEQLVRAQVSKTLIISSPWLLHQGSIQSALAISPRKTSNSEVAPHSFTVHCPTRLQVFWDHEQKLHLKPFKDEWTPSVPRLAQELIELVLALGDVLEGEIDLAKLKKLDASSLSFLLASLKPLSDRDKAWCFQSKSLEDRLLFLRNRFQNLIYQAQQTRGLIENYRHHQRRVLFN